MLWKKAFLVCLIVSVTQAILQKRDKMSVYYVFVGVYLLICACVSVCIVCSHRHTWIKKQGKQKSECVTVLSKVDYFRVMKRWWIQFIVELSKASEETAANKTERQS